MPRPRRSNYRTFEPLEEREDEREHEQADNDDEDYDEDHPELRWKRFRSRSRKRPSLVHHGEEGDRWGIIV